MNKKIFWGKSLRDLLIPYGWTVIVLLFAGIFIYRHLDPAPPNHLTIATGEDESDLNDYAEEYRDILKRDGVKLEIRSSEGPKDNLRLLEEDAAEVDAAFVPDGVGSMEDQPDVESLGSLFYEPIWIFYRGSQELSHLSQLEGKRIAVGQKRRGTHILARRLMRMSGVDMKKTTFLNIDSKDSAEALRKGEVDAAMFMRPPDDPLIHDLMSNKGFRLMNMQQAEAVSRLNASFHHLVLPRGAIDLKQDLPHEDVHLLASTGTLLVRDDLHPALAYLLLKAASQVHGDSSILEKRGEFPTNKDDQFLLSDGAVQFYKSGGTFWQRYLPYWIAAWLDRFVLLVIPVLAVAYPLLRLIPMAYFWRIRLKLYQRYGELKHLEAQIREKPDAMEQLEIQRRLDSIEDRVNRMRVPRNFNDYVYSLRGHIQFVRDRLARTKTGARP